MVSLRRALALAAAVAMWLTWPLGCSADGGVPGEPYAAGAGGSAGAGGATGSAGAGGTAAGGGTAGAGGQGPGMGTWDDPFLITELPFTVTGDTALAPSDLADHYEPCGPSIDEGGGEVVYRLVVDQSGWLEVALDDVSGDAVDVDVHLLGAPSPGACWARDDVRVGMTVAPGDYWITVDTWVDGSDTPLAGPYVLTGVLVTDAGECFVSPIYCEDFDAPFVNGVPEEEPGDPGCLPGMARVDSFCVDRYEAILVELLPGGLLGPWSPYESPGTVPVQALNVVDAVPQGHINQVEAADACLMAGKRLCTDAEWLRACMGPASTTYPYGEQLQPGWCNDDRTCHPVQQYFETDEGWIWSELDHPCINQLPAGLALTGSYDACTSAEGIFDLMGSLHEWTDDPAGTFRGGFYVDTVVNGSGCLYATTAHNVWHWDYSTGFRCCADAS